MAAGERGVTQVRGELNIRRLFGMLNSSMALLEEERDAESRLTGGDCDGLGAHGIPTLLLWGERDAYMLRAEQEALLARLPSATLTALADTGHAPHWERPAAVADALRPFLARMADAERARAIAG